MQTQTIAENLIPETLDKKEIGKLYATEADVLNIAVFGQKAWQWKQKNPTKSKGDNMRDDASLEKLIVLANLESRNAELIQKKVPREERIVLLNALAREQLIRLTKNKSFQNFNAILAQDKVSLLSKDGFEGVIKS